MSADGTHSLTSVQKVAHFPDAVLSCEAPESSLVLLRLDFYLGLLEKLEVSHMRYRGIGGHRCTFCMNYKWLSMHVLVICVHWNFFFFVSTLSSVDIALQCSAWVWSLPAGVRCLPWPKVRFLQAPCKRDAHREWGKGTGGRGEDRIAGPRTCWKVYQQHKFV